MMTTDQSRKFIQDYIAAICREKSEETIDKYVSDPHLKSHIVIFETGMPGYQLHIKDMIAEGNKVCVRFLSEGVHKGELFGQSPTGKKVQVDGIIIYEIENNKIVRHWLQADSIALMQQIGSSTAEVENNK